ncbi:MAG: TrmH family RNA methyltransferase [Solirubrobacteraceae bacterium]
MSPGPSGRAKLIDTFRRARRDTELAVVEGFHALKHALRFDAELLVVLRDESSPLGELARELAPDLRERIEGLAEPLPAQSFAQLAPRAARTGVVALARRPAPALDSLLKQSGPAPIVLLEEPRDLNNVGACIRVAAAADAAGVIVIGRHDPWHADAIRGSAGLHFALPVEWARALPLAQLRDATRPLVALDPDGELTLAAELPPHAVLAFGSERSGLSGELLGAADARLRIPMRSGVSSLNLATSVAAVLYGARLAGSSCEPDGPDSRSHD